ncbi:DUF2079 domain-containing protein, partial [Patescibacteria group bacterium]|nr:DUF2079 domain-containing protein [Patescibacteria group bacterium]
TLQRCLVKLMQAILESERSHKRESSARVEATLFSIFSLSLEHLGFLVGFFVFSLLMGYLSLITPMGLGVREGVLTFGLSKLIPLSMAGFLSIYTRFALMLSELLFLIFSVLLFKIKALNKKVNYISKHFYELGLLCFIFIYNLYFIITTFLRHDNFYTGRFDLGNMDQVVWNTINGRIFQFTNPDGVNVMSRLSFHADFLLIFLSPLYLIWNNPKILLLIQTLAISVGAIFIYLIAKLILKNKKLALLFSFIFLLNPALQFVNLYDFHAVAFSTTFLLAASFYLIRKNIPLMLIFLFLAGITKEQIWLIVGLFGCLLAIKSYFCKKRVNANIAIGLILAFFSFSFFYYLVNFAMPLARGGEEHFALSYYSEFGESPKSIIQNVILSPDKVVETVFQKEKIDYLFQIFGPLGFLSFVSPGFLIFTIPDFLIKLLSQNKQLYQIYYQYSASVTPFVFISAIYSISYLIKKMPKMHNFLVIYLLFWSLYTAYLFGPLPGARKPNIDMYIKQQEDKLEIKKVLSIIPNESSISASNSLGAHLMHRQNIFTAPIATESADFVVLLLRSPNKDLHLINNLKQNINYKIKVEEKSIILFEKNR